MIDLFNLVKASKSLCSDFLWVLKHSKELQKSLKLRVPLNYFRLYHRNICHTSVDLARQMAQNDEKAVLRSAQDLLDSSCNLISHILHCQIPNPPINACVKFLKQNEGGEYIVSTWIRSKNSYNRSFENDEYSLKQSSIFCALSGQEDENNHNWDTFHFFHCGNLHNRNFATPRTDEWKNSINRQLCSQYA
ncbi:hypothetical protein L21SP3_01563 [Sedimentisphaera cyanobacteriorum]|uniref:Uncharacterized protein n=1 Tax=Sedimentisphaera cyanobacteriorum TaxID=1940790 RepID=A0A1Q2HQZ3_9BACT|nr:hypothetical protein L21SP3_01563 [Sedimentisphaera cyanobacteriorum]